MYQQFESGRLDHRNRAIHLVQIGFRNVSHQQSRHNGSGGTSVMLSIINHGYYHDLMILGSC
jgi:hypothetical protein